LQNGAKASRPVVFAFALAILFETWIWNRVIALLHAFVALIPLTRLKTHVVALVNLLPAPAALLLFLLPLVFVELGSFGSVVLIATGHFIAGAVIYVALKVLGLGLVAAIFDLTRDKLMSMRWFVIAYHKFTAFHDYAHQLIAPYTKAAKAYIAEMREGARAYAARVLRGAKAEIE
jgi:hypothetical protein